MKKSDVFWQTYLTLEKEAVELSKFIFFTDEILVNKNGKMCSQSWNTQLEVFSSHIADLLVRCCVQIEAISKELYFDNGGTKKRGDSTLAFDVDCLKLIDQKWKTSTKIVMIVAPFSNFTKDENRFLRPLKNAHKTQGAYWEKAYQAVKHDRYTCLNKGNVRAFLQALAALYLLNIYYRKDSWVTKYQDISKLDYSLGSSIFSVKPPVTQQLWYGNIPVYSESPYVVRYRDDDYQRIKDIQEKEAAALNDYWSKQPELLETDFQIQLRHAMEKEKNDPHQRLMPFWELAIYRLNKKTPNTLPFEERKKRLINSEEWNGWIHQHNNHLSADEITEDNIQKEIESIGALWGVEIMKNYQKLEWLPIALNSEICKIYIPESNATST